MVATWPQVVSLLLDLFVFGVGIFAIWCGFQVCGEFSFVLLAVARCYWRVSLDMDD